MKYFIYFILFFLNYVFADNEMKILKVDYYISNSDFKKALDELLTIDFSKIDENKKAYIYNKAGFIYFNLNKFDDALKYYFIALQLNPNLYFVYNNIGVLYFRLKDYNNAKNFFLKAYEINREYPKVLINLAEVEFLLRNYYESYKWLIKALNFDRNYVIQRFNSEKAIKKIEEMVKDNPDDKELQNILKFVKNKGVIKNGMDF